MKAVSLFQEALRRIPFRPGLKRFGFYVAVFMLILFLYRFAFVLVYSYRLRGAPLGEIVWAFLVGFRFDVSAVTVLLLPFLVVSFLQPFNRFAIYRQLWSFAPIVLVVWLVCLLTADVVYFENGNKHVGYEGYAFLADLGLLLRSALQMNLSTLLAGVLVLASLLPFLVRFHNKNPVPATEDPWWSAGPAVLIALLVGGVLIRGGLQASPLRPNDAMVSRNDFLNNVGLNPVYTMLMDWKTFSIPKQHRLPPAEALYLTRNAIDYPGAEFVSERYPLLRKIGQTRGGRPPNIVLVLLENWTGKFVRPITNGVVDGKEVSPQFNQLARQGIFFDRFFANGGRTTGGMMAALAGIPDKPGLTVVRTHHILNNFSGIGSILKTVGYRTTFVTGGPLNFDNKHTVLPHFGFERVLGYDEIRTLGRKSTGKWGFDDADVLDVLHEQLLQNAGEPHLAVALTLSTHYPYSVPDPRFNIFGESVRDYEYLNSYHYADWAVGQFMKKAKQSPYFKNTVFLFVGDHTHHRFLNYYEDRNVPFLIIWKDQLQPSIRSDTASQLDIIPTILGFVGKPVYFSAMGKDLLKPGLPPAAYFAYGNVFGWIGRRSFYHQLTDAMIGTARKVGATEYDIPSCFTKDLECEILQRRAQAFLNVSIDLIDANRIFPPRGADLASLDESGRTLPGCGLSASELKRRLEARVRDLLTVQQQAMDPTHSRAVTIDRLSAFFPAGQSYRRSAEDFYDLPIFQRTRREGVPPSHHEILKIDTNDPEKAEVSHMQLMSVTETQQIRNKGIMVSNATWKRQGCHWYLDFHPPQRANALR